MKGSSFFVNVCKTDFSIFFHFHLTYPSLGSHFGQSVWTVWHPFSSHSETSHHSASPLQLSPGSSSWHGPRSARPWLSVSKHHLSYPWERKLYQRCQLECPWTCLPPPFALTSLFFHGPVNSPNIGYWPTHEYSLSALITDQWPYLYILDSP